ncbi:hypothetical protein PV08_09952 [Exophiala spinifera]|uniref:Dimethylaniline monooxygenase n=1 Tax=Exophiala spinifera TaxID=91928 RepID=A0A0D2BNG2_9EURO|nr:uncharacterized protein PV08_09952 [Exophiala spinifera]KIW12674.1 hypothetical protein PV08_09952 [Exophiala spinifera]
MPARHPTVAVIGTGPSGIAATKALSDENIFDRVRVFERRDRIGGTWNYDPVPDPFSTGLNGQLKRSLPSHFPHSAPLTAEDTSGRTGLYDTLDSNVGAKVMAFTHTPLPDINSAASIERYGRDNPTRPFRVVAHYLEDVFRDYYHLVSFNTSVERVEKVNGKWVLTLRRSDHILRGERREYWWQETFDAVVVATGHYNIPAVPQVSGLREAYAARPEAFEHSKAYRSPDDYVGKKVIVVGGNVSAADIVADIQGAVSGPLFLAQRGVNEFFKPAFQLPNVVTKPQLKEIKSTTKGIEVEFGDGTKVSGVDKVIFATGYRLSYPFLSPDPVTPNNRLAGFYQHLFKIGDPSLTVIGQLKAGISFRVYEYQAVAVARYFAGREAKPLPPPSEQDLWETKRLETKGPGINFHELRLEWPEYYGFLVDLAGPAAAGSFGYELPPWQDKWAELGFSVIQLKDKYWKRSALEQIRARL